MSYDQYSQNPHQQALTQESGYDYRQSNLEAQQDQYELHDYNSNYGRQPQQSPVMSQQAFLDKVQGLRKDINSLTQDVDHIGQLHQRILSSADDSDRARQQLEQYISQTQIRNTAIKDQIKGLERDLAGSTSDTYNLKNKHLQSLKSFFTSELDKYQSLERDYQHRYRDQIARQYRIVNPDASEQEVEQAANANWSDEGVFTTALRTNRTGHASSVLGNVRARHSELQRIEQTLYELGRIHTELAAVVEQQDHPIQAAEASVEETHQNIAEGNIKVKEASKNARNRRKLKWWCALVVVLIIVAIALGVGLGVCSLTQCWDKNK